MPTSFQTLGLRQELLQAIDRVGFTEMTPIQTQALPVMLQGGDVTGQAQTGSGKTAAYGLALLNAIDTSQATTQALVLCPTRELAEQVANELRRLAQCLPNTRVLAVCGGHPNRDQVQALEAGSHVVVGTPGRLGKHRSRGSLDLSQLRLLVLDEADRMLDMGFIDQVLEIIDECPLGRQTLLFSATFPPQIQQLSAGVQRSPVFVGVQAQVEPEKLRQLVFECDRGQRNQLLVNLLTEYRPTTTLVFCETRSDCDKLAAFLTGRGALALALHGQLDQRERDDVLLRFANGSASVLVATNVAARGLDIPALPVVIVAELSPDPESHLHRIGRTGRAGEAGLALSIVSGPRELHRLRQIEEYMGGPLERGSTPAASGGLDFLQPKNRTLLIMAGRKDKLRPGDVLGALVKQGGIPPEAIGRIDLLQKVCAVAVAAEHAQQALASIQAGRIKKQKVRARLLG